MEFITLSLDDLVKSIFDNCMAILRCTNSPFTPFAFRDYLKKFQLSLVHIKIHTTYSKDLEVFY